MKAEIAYSLPSDPNFYRCSPKTLLNSHGWKSHFVEITIKVIWSFCVLVERYTSKYKVSLNKLACFSNFRFMLISLGYSTVEMSYCNPASCIFSNSNPCCLCSNGDRVPLHCVDRHPNQQHIVATGGQDGMLCIWDMRQGNMPSSLMEAHSAESASVICAHNQFVYL